MDAAAAAEAAAAANAKAAFRRGTRARSASFHSASTGEVMVISDDAACSDAASDGAAPDAPATEEDAAPDAPAAEEDAAPDAPAAAVKDAADEDDAASMDSFGSAQSRVSSMDNMLLDAAAAQEQEPEYNILKEQHPADFSINKTVPGIWHSKNFISGDGSCQFRALAWWRFGTQSKHVFVRQKVVGWLRGHQTWLSKKVVDTTARKYITQMGYTRTWGDAITLYAAVEAYGVCCWVCSASPDGLLLELQYPGGYTREEALEMLPQYGLYLAEEHYEVLLRINRALEKLDTPAASPEL